MYKLLFPLTFTAFMCTHPVTAGLLRTPLSYRSALIDTPLTYAPHLKYGTPLTYAGSLTPHTKYGYSTSYATPLPATPFGHTYTSTYAAAPYLKYATASPPWASYSTGAYLAPSTYAADYAAAASAFTDSNPLIYATPATYAASPLLTKYTATAPWSTYAAALNAW